MMKHSGAHHGIDGSARQLSIFGITLKKKCVVRDAFLFRDRRSVRNRFSRKIDPDGEPGTRLGCSNRQESIATSIIKENAVTRMEVDPSIDKFVGKDGSRIIVPASNTFLIGRLVARMGRRMVGIRVLDFFLLSIDETLNPLLIVGLLDGSQLRPELLKGFS